MKNADMQLACVVHSQTLAWVESPSRQVLRKRFHLVGAAEAGQVTSLVTYQPGASFSRHEHVDGEEILVLEGLFSDEHGDWPAGSWLLNPEGFAHQPFSRDGCLLLVKLRQYTGQRQAQVYWPTTPVSPDPRVGVLLDEHAGVTTRIVTLADGELFDQHYESGVEGFVVAGQLVLDGSALHQHDWFRLPRGSQLTLISRGCTIYLKENAVAGLRHCANAHTDAAEDTH